MNKKIREKIDAVIGYSDVESWHDDKISYLLMAIARDKENPHLDEEIKSRRIVSDQEEIGDALEYFTRNFGDEKEDYRIYITVNPRDTVKAYFNFLDTLNGWMKDKFYGEDGIDDKIKSISSEWKSEIHRPQNASDSLFLIDYDGDMTIVERFLSSLKKETELHGVFQTPNGCHVVTDPFDYTDFDHPTMYEVKTSGMVFIGWV